jgi:hypothetical protein
MGNPYYIETMIRPWKTGPPGRRRGWGGNQIGYDPNPVPTWTKEILRIAIPDEGSGSVAEETCHHTQDLAGPSYKILKNLGHKSYR